MGNCPITCNILVQILLRVLQRAGWRLKWAGWRWVELGGGGWSWVEVGAWFSNTLYLLDTWLAILALLISSLKAKRNLHFLQKQKSQWDINYVQVKCTYLLNCWAYLLVLSEINSSNLIFSGHTLPLVVSW